MTLAADFTNGSKRMRPTLTLYAIEAGRRIQHASGSVYGKREARKIAVALGYTPWNF